MTNKLPLRQRLEGLGARLMFRLAGMAPLRVASAAGGFIGRTIGPRLAITRRARRHLNQAIPGLSPSQQDHILREMWDNLGRVVLEYPHLAGMRMYGPGSPVEIVGLEHFDTAVATGRPVILFSGHLGNWEIGALAAVQRGLRVLLIYRAANNPVVEELMIKVRGALGVEAVPKGSKGARGAAAAVRAGGVVGMLVDQKMNDGIPVPFFGRDAWTAPALAKLALRYNAVVVPWRVERLKGATFRLTAYPAIDFQPTGDTSSDVIAFMTRVNQILEGWIRETPGQWFWLHRRWPNEER